MNTDFGNRFNIDVELDAHAIPFANDSLGNVVGVDVLHHFAKPRLALLAVSYTHLTLPTILLV